MTAYELAQLLNISVPQAQDFIERCDRFDTYMDSLYDLEAVARFDQQMDDAIEAADWSFDWSIDEHID